MKFNIDDNKNLSRRDFLKKCGTVLAAGAIIGVLGKLLPQTSAEELANKGCEQYPDGVPANAKKCDKCSTSNCPIRKGVTL